MLLEQLLWRKQMLGCLSLMSETSLGVVLELWNQLLLAQRLQVMRPKTWLLLQTLTEPGFWLWSLTRRRWVW